MYTMDQIYNIRQLFFEQGMNLTDIAKTAKCNWRTARKYVDMEDFSPSVPILQGTNRESKLDPFKPLIDEWLLADKKAPRNHRHTAKRIHKRLKNETKGFRCSVTVKKSDAFTGQFCCEIIIPGRDALWS